VFRKKRQHLVPRCAYGHGPSTGTGMLPRCAYGHGPSTGTGMLSKHRLAVPCMAHDLVAAVVEQP
jgi:hypothetical protein